MVQATFFKGQALWGKTVTCVECFPMGMSPYRNFCAAKMHEALISFSHENSSIRTLAKTHINSEHAGKFFLLLPDT